MKYALVEYYGTEPVVISSDNKRAVLINDVLGTDFNTLLEVIRNHTAEQREMLYQASQGSKGLGIENVRLLAPIQYPIHDIICLGVNYNDHLEESKKHFGDGGFGTPEDTVYFGKRASFICGPDDRIDGHLDMDRKLDYEVELAVIIGKKVDSSTRHEDIADTVFGYSVFNDISARTLQARHMQWYYGKSLDTFSAMGPWIVSSDEIAIDEALAMESRINNEVRQHSNTGLMRKNVEDIIYDLSRGMTLEAGDIIATGTPSGVGQGFIPSRFMSSGDCIEAEIERIGILRNFIA